MDWSAVSGIASAVIALAALTFSVQSFKAQQRWSEKNARANVRPFFWTKLQTYQDLKSIILRNDGVGPAVVTTATFTKNGRSTNRLVELFDVPIPVWEMFTAVSPGRVVPPQGEIVLVKQSLNHLLGQGIDASQGRDILKDWQSQRRGIEIRVEFEDIYGNAIQPYER
jgi:hypothetical protein